MAKFIKAARFIVEDENGFVIAEADTYEEAQSVSNGGTIIDTQSNQEEGGVFQSRRPVKSSQKGFENVAEGTQYDDYHIDTRGMGILDVENIIDAIESRGNQAVLTVQTSDGSTNHSQFDSKSWKEYKDAVNGVDGFGGKGAAITDVWITEVDGGSYVRNSRKPIKSSYEDDETVYENALEELKSKNIEGYFYAITPEDYKEFIVNLEDFREYYDVNYYHYDTLYDAVIECMDYIFQGGIEFVIDYEGNIIWDPRKNITALERIAFGGDWGYAAELINDSLVQNINSSRKPIKSSHKGDTFVESYKGFDIFTNLTEEGNFPNVYIYDSSNGDEIKEIKSINRNEAIWRLTDKAKEFIDDYITSSRKQLYNSRNLETELVKKILSGRLNKDKAAKILAMSKGCNLGYAKQILSTWIEERSPSLIKSGARHVVLDNAYDPDGNIDSWSVEYVPQSGMADTKAGEILRAFNQIQCSWFNHGYKVGDYKGSEYVNSAARFLKSHTDEKISGLLESAKRCHDIESYDNIIQSMKTSLENYLTNNSHLFNSVNEEDMWDEFDEDDNDSGELDDIKLVNGNSYIQFKNEDGSWVCTKINVDTEYNEGDTFTLEDDIAENFESGDGEYGDFVSDGIHYSWEVLNDNEYRINAVSFEDDYFVEDSDYTSDEIIAYCADNPDWVLCNKDNDEVDMDYFN